MANAKGMQPSAVETTSYYTIKYDYDSNDNCIYIGKANIGTVTSVASWQIARLTWTAGTVSGFNCTAQEWADGDMAFDNIWDNRASLSYS